MNSNSNSNSTTSTTSTSSTPNTSTTSKPTNIGICGLGCVGNSMYQHFLKNTSVKPVGYDKFKQPFDSEEIFQEILKTDMVFLCLPTLYDPAKEQYNKDAIFDVCKRLNEGKYKGLVVLKSTVEPETTEKLSDKYQDMDFAHNPEFLSAATCFEDFTNQPHVVLGKSPHCDEKKFNGLVEFYKQFWPYSEYSLCSSFESELMKSGCNSFYAFKIAYFNTLFLLTQEHSKLNDKEDPHKTYNNAVSMMLKNGWINPMHTKIAPDGRLGFGGACFPKDINAMNQYVKSKGLMNGHIDGVVEFNRSLRNDVPY